MRIDDRSSIPLTWMAAIVVFLLTVGTTSTITGTVWVFRVNGRLDRIEKHMGISSDITMLSKDPIICCPIQEEIEDAEYAKIDALRGRR